MTGRQPLRRPRATRSTGDLRILIAIPAVLHTMVLMSLPAVADFIRRTAGGAPLSPSGRLILADARIALMLVASLTTIIVAVKVASATLRSLRHLSAAGTEVRDTREDISPSASTVDARGLPLPPAASLQTKRPSPVASRPFIGSAIGPPASALRLVIGHETSRESR
jgi:hypothetical protein